jgi:AraC-like DNA-binding protein
MIRTRERFEVRLREYLEACYTVESPPRVSELADRLGLSVGQLSKLFRRLYGGKLSDYFKARQVEYAEKLLRDTSLTVTKVAYKAAFGTRRTFFRTYRRVKGETPEQYRARMQSFGGGGSGDPEERTDKARDPFLMDIAGLPPPGPRSDREERGVKPAIGLQSAVRPGR